MITQAAVQMHFKLTPSLARLLILLLEQDVVTADDIVSRRIAKSGKVIVHRLRTVCPTVKIESRMGVGYWLTAEQKEALKAELGLSSAKVVWQDPTDWSTEATDGGWYAEKVEDTSEWKLFYKGHLQGVFPSKEDAQKAAGGK